MSVEGKTVDLVKFRKVLMPFLDQKRSEVLGKRYEFAHYTSASTAISIISRKTVWLRNARLMNDFSEIEHGDRLLKAAWRDQELGERLKRILRAVDSKIPDNVAKILDGQAAHRYFESYLLSISEHGNPESVNDEDKYGRLSMWRAYGGNCNVALIFKTEAFLDENNTIGAFASPVAYHDESSFQRYFGDYLDGLERNIDFLRDLGKEGLSSIISWIFHVSTVSLKHPGFAEEREWRIVLSPTLATNHSLNRSLEIIDGIPQTVYKLTLDGTGASGERFSIKNILRKIIVGPTDQPAIVAQALIGALLDAGFEGADGLVEYSGIPLRR